MYRQESFDPSLWTPTALATAGSTTGSNLNDSQRPLAARRSNASPLMQMLLRQHGGGGSFNDGTATAAAAMVPSSPASLPLHSSAPQTPVHQVQVTHVSSSADTPPDALQTRSPSTLGVASPQPAAATQRPVYTKVTRKSASPPRAVRAKELELALEAAQARAERAEQALCLEQERAARVAMLERRHSDVHLLNMQRCMTVPQQQQQHHDNVAAADSKDTLAGGGAADDGSVAELQRTLRVEIARLRELQLDLRRRDEHRSNAAEEERRAYEVSVMKLRRKGCE